LRERATGRVSATAALLALGLLACGGDVDEPSADALWERLWDRYQGCGLYGEGARPASPTVADPCVLRCLAALACEDLREVLCHGAGGDPHTQGCEATCGATFACADGFGEIPGRWRCDGDPDCDDGSDELSCPLFTCADGGEILERWRCSGHESCADGSDEAGCPAFVCADGGEVSARVRCDGHPACADASDEAGCAEPTLACP